MSAPPVAAAARSAAWRSVRRLLVVRLDQIGDVLMTTPALAALRSGLPAADVTLLTSPGAAVLAPHLHPLVDRVWTAQVSWMPGIEPTEGHGDAALVERLRAGGFDAAIVFTVCTQSALPAALVCRMAGIPLRLAHARENPYGLLSDWAAERDAALSLARTEPGEAPALRHEVRRQLDLVGEVGFTATERPALHLRLRDADRLEARAQPRSARPLAILHPGASAASRRWSPAGFGAVAGALAAQGLEVRVCGGPGEAALVDEVLKHAQGLARPVARPLSLGGLAAWMQDAALVVTNNSGPAHLAAAVGAPLVCVYAGTNPQHTPWTGALRLVRHATACAGCLRSRCPVAGHPCLQDISAQAVIDAALDCLRQWPPRREDDAA